MGETLIPRDPIRDPKWLTTEGATESAAFVTDQVTQALASKEAFWEYIRLGWLIGPWSPLECVVPDGMRTIALFVKCSQEDTEAVRQCLISREYPIKTQIAAAVFQSCGVGVRQLVNPQESFFLNAAVEGWMDQVRRKAKDLGEAVEILGGFAEANISFRNSSTPEGRVGMIVEPTAQILENPALLAEALRRVRVGYGAWGEPQESNYSRAVALGIEKLLEL